MKRDLFLSLFLTISLLPYVHLQTQRVQEQQNLQVEQVAEPVAEVETSFGFPLDSFRVESHTISNGQTMGNLLNELGVAYDNVLQLLSNADTVFNYKTIRAGKPYHIISSLDSSKHFFVYQPNPIEYITFELQDSFRVNKQELELEIRSHVASASIESSLWNALVDNGMSPEIAVELSDIYAWTINFFALQKGDKFKLIYDEKWVDGQMIGYGKIHAAIFNHGGEDFYAIPFEQDGDWGYYNRDGKSLEADFLKAPVKFSRISSGYTGRRFHPVQKRWKAHLGTDFAAPTGTPIMSTANGTVEAAQYSQFNGNYVKVKHNQTISTQYLHMSKIAPGIRPGVAVRQGQVIGYVGSTGLASGPHVCYRFWRDGKQVDSQSVRISATRKIEGANQAAFDSTATVWIQRLNAAPYPQAGEQFAAGTPEQQKTKETAR